MSTTVIDTPIGPLALTAGSAGLVRIDFGPIPGCLDPGPGVEADAHLTRAVTELDEYFAGERRTFTVALDRSTRKGFRGEVLAALEEVPFGETVSYGELAGMAGRPLASRAVGTAMATNPLPLVVPCHRVIAAGGALGGYGPGAELKVQLLELEGSWPAP
jgi:methylated-DNA-[protein]-cysteine S-methyltransferase